MSKSRLKKKSRKSKLMWIFIALAIFLGGSLYAALQTGTGPLSFLSQTPDINKVKTCNQDAACIDLMIEAAEKGIKVDNTGGKLSTENFAKAVQRQAERLPKDERDDVKLIQDAARLAGRSTQSVAVEQPAGDVPAAQSTIVPPPATSCAGGNGVKLTPDKYAATGYGLQADGKTQCTTGGCPKRECIEIKYDCSHGVVVACDEQYAKNPSSVILPVNAGPEYYAGKTQAQIRDDEKKNLAPPPKPKENCYDKSGVIMVSGSQLGSDRCLNGDWQPDKSKSCNSTQTYNSSTNTCETTLQPAGNANFPPLNPGGKGTAPEGANVVRPSECKSGKVSVDPHVVEHPNGIFTCMPSSFECPEENRKGGDRADIYCIPGEDSSNPSGIVSVGTCGNLEASTPGQKWISDGDGGCIPRPVSPESPKCGSGFTENNDGFCDLNARSETIREQIRATGKAKCDVEKKPYDTNTGLCQTQTATRHMNCKDGLSVDKTTKTECLKNNGIITGSKISYCSGTFDATGTCQLTPTNFGSTPAAPANQPSINAPENNPTVQAKLDKMANDIKDSGKCTDSIIDVGIRIVCDPDTKEPTFDFCDGGNGRFDNNGKCIPVLANDDSLNAPSLVKSAGVGALWGAGAGALICGGGGLLTGGIAIPLIPACLVSVGTATTAIGTAIGYGVAVVNTPENINNEVTFPNGRVGVHANSPAECKYGNLAVEDPQYGDWICPTENEGATNMAPTIEDPIQPVSATQVSHTVGGASAGVGVCAAAAILAAPFTGFVSLPIGTLICGGMGLAGGIIGYNIP